MFSSEPKVKLLAWTDKPLALAVASARTCYSDHVIFADEVNEGQRQRIGSAIFEAGHHTPFQHSTFVFGLENVSRQFVWSFLHSHPYYNSDQSSQRYNVLGEIKAFLPELEQGQRQDYGNAVEQSWKAYAELLELLKEEYAGLMVSIGKIRGQSDKQIETEAEKKAVENARYVLPIAAFTSLYHTVSGITLKRYASMVNACDCPNEARLVVNAMLEEAGKVDGQFVDLGGVKPLEALPEQKPQAADGDVFAKRFDERLDGMASKLVQYNADAEKIVAEAVNEVLGTSMLEDEAIDLLVNPQKNPYLLDAMNSWVHSPLMRCLNHATYSFKKKISHTADSQDQRHRTVPASRPLLTRTHRKVPDFITPRAVKENKETQGLYAEAIGRLWQAKNELVEAGAPPEKACYLLPNATALRFTETGSFLNLLHKWRMRLCFNAQQEIFEHSMQELQQVVQVHPRLARHVGPPCFARRYAHENPCPEGSRWCGVKVWLNFPNVKRPF